MSSQQTPLATGPLGLLIVLNLYVWAVYALVEGVLHLYGAL